MTDEQTGSSDLGHWAKTYEGKWRGSMVGAPALAYALWDYILCYTNFKKGVVELNPLILSTLIGDATPDAIEAQIQMFCEPDPRSRTKEHEGRKLVRIGEWAYQVVNWRKYQPDGRTPEERLEQSRQGMQRLRAARKAEQPTTTQPPDQQEEKIPKRKKKPALPDDPAFEAIWKLHNDYCKELSTRGIRASSGKKTEAKVEWFKIPADRRNRIHAILADQIEADAFNYGSLGYRVQNLSNYLKSGKWDAAVPEKVEVAAERPNEGFKVAVESLVYTSDHARGWVCGRMGWVEFGVKEDEAWIAMPYEEKVALYRAYEKRGEVGDESVLF